MAVSASCGQLPRADPTHLFREEAQVLEKGEFPVQP